MQGYTLIFLEIYPKNNIILKIGDTVMIIDDSVEGKIIAIKHKIITIKTLEGFEIEYSKNEVVLIPNSNNQLDYESINFEQVLAEKEYKKPKKIKRVKPKERNQPLMEVDLHIHQLVSNEKGLTAHDKLELQLEIAQRKLEFAIHKRIQRVVFIHGIGAGVLRAELEYLFRRYDAISYEDADFKKYGRGATQVYIFQNAKTNS